jgi:hypothetical protein
LSLLAGAAESARSISASLHYLSYRRMRLARDLKLYCTRIRVWILPGFVLDGLTCGRHVLSFRSFWQWLEEHDRLKTEQNVHRLVLVTRVSRSILGGLQNGPSNLTLDEC